MAMTKALDNRGLTLVTVVVAMTILTIALTMAASTFISASRLTMHAAHFAAASSFAEGVMERVKSRPFSEIGTTEITRDLPRLDGAGCIVEVVPRGDGLKQVTVTCSWVEKDVRQGTGSERTRRVRFSTLVARGGQ